MTRSPDTTERRKRLVNATVLGFFFGALVGAGVHPHSMTSLAAGAITGAVSGALAMLVKLAGEGRHRRKFSPVVREPRCSHVAVREGRAA